MRLGFRSSFNFVPEGEYDTPSSLRSFLADHGFEVGVHDLHHDGTLYRSKAEFSAAAKCINEHLRALAGGRIQIRVYVPQPRMAKRTQRAVRRLEHSTPTPSSLSQTAGPIFPFWVGRSDKRRLRRTAIYAASGFNPFPGLGPETNDIWKRKLDWVARHGGMASSTCIRTILRLENGQLARSFR